LGRCCRARRAHVMIHFAENSEETEWLEHGKRTDVAILANCSADERAMRSERAAMARSAHELLVHGNLASRGETPRASRRAARPSPLSGALRSFRRER